MIIQNQSLNWKLECTCIIIITVYETSSEMFDIGHCPIKIEVTVENFSVFTTIQIIKSYTQVLVHVRKSD